MATKKRDEKSSAKVGDAKGAKVDGAPAWLDLLDEHQRDSERTSPPNAKAEPESDEAAKAFEEVRRLCASPARGSNHRWALATIRAICRHRRAQYGSSSPFVVSAIEVIDRAAYFAERMPSYGFMPATDPLDRMGIGRRLGAALLILDGKATFGARRTVLDQGVLWESIAAMLERLADGFVEAPEAEQVRLVSEARIYILATTGRRPSQTTTRAALLVALQRGPSKKIVTTTHREAAEAGEKRVPSKNKVFRDLMGEIGMRPQSVASLKKARTRQKKRHPEASK